MRQSFFHNDSRNYVDLGGGVFGCRGFHSSFRATQEGLSLNMGKSLEFRFLSPGMRLSISYNLKALFHCRCINHHDC